MSTARITLTTTMVADRYSLVRGIAQGGMGSVWLARDEKLDRQVAVKVMAQELARTPELITRFKREALAAAQLRSAHVVQVYDYGVHDNLPFIVMELLEGESLGTRLRREKRLGIRETAVILLQVAKGLKAAHQAGLVHRDLKPSNIFLASRDDVEVVKLLDFGVVKAVDQRGTSDATATGLLLGTPHYMSPEQVRGLRTIDHRSDLWSVGVLVFRMLSGVNPFRGESVGDVVLRIYSDELPRLSTYCNDLPEELERFFARAFERDPNRRFQGAEELASAFIDICAPYLSSLTIMGTPTTGTTFFGLGGLADSTGPRPRIASIPPAVGSSPAVASAPAVGSSPASERAPAASAPSSAACAPPAASAPPVPVTSLTPGSDVFFSAPSHFEAGSAIDVMPSSGPGTWDRPPDESRTPVSTTVGGTQLASKLPPRDRLGTSRASWIAAGAVVVLLGAGGAAGLLWLRSWPAPRGASLAPASNEPYVRPPASGSSASPRANESVPLAPTAVVEDASAPGPTLDGGSQDPEGGVDRTPRGSSTAEPTSGKKEPRAGPSRSKKPAKPEEQRPSTWW